MLIFSMAVLLISCTTRGVSLDGNKTQALTVFEEYSKAIADAEKSTDKEEFNKLFLNKAVIPLPGDKIQNLSQLRVGKEGDIYICDYERKIVARYDSLGNSKGNIGKTGNQPGSYMFPTDVFEVETSSVAIPDFQTHRVNIFSKDDSFSSSFVYTPQRFSAQRLIYNEANNSYYLFGNRWQTNEKGENTGADLIHKYSSTGEYLISFQQFPERSETS